MIDPTIEPVLKKLEAVPNREKLYWNVPRSTGNFLNILVKAVRAKTVLEIGTSNGYSGLFFADALRETGGKLITVESKKERFQLARETFEQAGVQDIVEQIFGHAPEILPSIFAQKTSTFDLVFIDATKMEYRSYAEILIDHLNPGGLLIADNALSHGSELTEYFALLDRDPRLQNQLLPFDNGLMLSYKRKV